jgi:hypothetical protein
MRPPVSSGTVYVKDHVDTWNREPSVGNAELAARLGSPVTFDRRGNVFAYDRFETSPLKWSKSFTTTGGGTGHSVTLSNDNVAHGEGCMKIVTPNKTGDYSRAMRSYAGLAHGNIGSHIILRLSALNHKTSTVLWARTGTKKVKAGIRVDSTGFSCLTGFDPALDASWTLFSSGQDFSINLNHPIKFVVDLDNEKYIRCLFSGIEFDLSAYTPFTSAFISEEFIEAEVYSVSGIDANGIIYCDDLILTSEEPA